MNTVFLLLAEFGQADVPVETVCSRYLGLDERQAKRQASLASLPFPVYRPGTQKGPLAGQDYRRSGMARPRARAWGE